MCDGGNCVTQNKTDGTSCNSGGTCFSGTCAVCGNGIKEGNEACDDGNRSNEDDCLNTCKKASCGDGYVRNGTVVEECDDEHTEWKGKCTDCKRTVYISCVGKSSSWCPSYNGQGMQCVQGYCTPGCSSVSQCPQIPGAQVACGYFCGVGCRDGKCPNGFQCDGGACTVPGADPI
jgi:cysteine-rich repeat protein